ncbi:hypothetical protein GCM10027034_19350 [Ramlibacter solisilvae]
MTFSAGNPAQVTNGAPWARRQYVQWQCATHLEGSLASTRTAPQRHDPMVEVGFMLINIL